MKYTLKLIFYFFFLRISTPILAKDNIVEFKDNSFQLSFKYDKREYIPKVVTPYSLSLSTGHGENEVTCLDKKYNQSSCPYFYIKGRESGSFKPKIAAKIENLEWHIMPSVYNPIMFQKGFEHISPVEYDGQSWSQSSIKVTCYKGLYGDLHNGDYWFIKTFYNHATGVSIRVIVVDTIFTWGDDKSIKDNYCERLDLLKDWDIGKHAKMVINSIKLNPAFFKHQAELKKTEDVNHLKSAPCTQPTSPINGTH